MREAVLIAVAFATWQTGGLLAHLTVAIVSFWRMSFP